MSNNSNLLDKIRQNRQRSTVASRDDSLFSSNRNEGTPLIQTEEISRNSEEELTIEQLKQRLQEFPQTRRRSGIVLEEELDRQLTQYCKDNRVTVETFLEAAWTIAIENEDETLLVQILNEAKRRYASRKEVGRLRRLLTSLSNLS